MNFNAKETLKEEITTLKNMLDKLAAEIDEIPEDAKPLYYGPALIQSEHIQNNMRLIENSIREFKLQSY